MLQQFVNCQELKEPLKNVFDLFWTLKMFYNVKKLTILKLFQYWYYLNGHWNKAKFLTMVFFTTRDTPIKVCFTVIVLVFGPKVFHLYMCIYSVFIYTLHPIVSCNFWRSKSKRSQTTLIFVVSVKHLLHLPQNSCRQRYKI